MIERLQQTLEKVQKHMDVEFMRPFMNLEFLKNIFSESPSLKASCSFSEIIKNLFNWIDRVENISEPSFENLQKLAMKELLKIFGKESLNLFHEVQNLELVFENQLLFDFGILKKDVYDNVTFCNIDAGIAVFGSSYLIKSCKRLEVIDLIIEMVADDEEYEMFKTCDNLGHENYKILDLILKDREVKKIYGKRMMENDNLLQRIFLKDTENKYDLVMRLILSAVEYGEPKKMKKILQETSHEKRETCLHRIAKYAEASLITFIKAVEDENLIDNLVEWLLEKNSDGNTFLFYVVNCTEIKDFIRKEIDVNLSFPTPNFNNN
jgi:hypothetical protein